MDTGFQRGISFVANSMVSVTSRIAGPGGTSQACCAMNSFRQSFCAVPPILPRGIPRVSASAT
jgi:hypothetical protein